MTMGVFNRFSDIINANINSILDQAEDPKKMVKLITLEMHETLVEIRATSARHIADKRKLEKQITFSRSEAGHWQEKAELAVSKGRDDLAKAALKEKAHSEESVVLLESEFTQLGDAISKLKGDAIQLEEKLEVARTRQKALILRGQTAKSRIKVKKQLHNVSFDDALSRFDLYERRIDEMEGVVETYDHQNRSLAQEINDLQNDEQLTHDLNALKSRMGGAGRIENTGKTATA
jgi:phage shock protein A